MPKGLKATSSLISIGAGVIETAANTFTELQVDLQLNPLDNEVFVIQSVDLNVTPPDFDITSNTATFGSMSSTSRTTIGNLSNSNVIAEARDDIRVDAGNSDVGVPFSRMSGETPATALEYLAIVATNDFFLQVQGSGNKDPKFISAKVYGYRARADAAVYAALVQSEVLTA